MNEIPVSAYVMTVDEYYINKNQIATAKINRAINGYYIMLIMSNGNSYRMGEFYQTKELAIYDLGKLLFELFPDKSH